MVNGRIVENLHVATRAAVAGARGGDRGAGGGAMTLLVLGLIVWTLVHLFKRAGAGRAREDDGVARAPGRRAG